MPAKFSKPLLGNKPGLNSKRNTSSASSESESDNQQQGQQQGIDHNESQQGSSSSSLKVVNLDICSNRLCDLYKATRNNLQNQNNINNLCQGCFARYEKNCFCLYCKQVYFEDSDDGKTWVMCDKCLRWLHAECAGLDNINNLSTPYECIKCKKVEGEDVVNNNKRGIQMNRNTSGKNVERRKTSQCRLNTFGFYWQLSPVEIAEDFEKFKLYLK